MKRRGVDESNLATVPLAILQTRGGDLSDDLVRFTQPIRYGDAQVTRTWEIAATKGQSLPIAADEDILVALQTLTARQGWPRELSRTT